MTSRRAAISFGGGALLLAYLAAANSTPGDGPAPQRDTARREAAATDAAVRDMRTEARRLHQRLSLAPAPEMHARNPFSFAPPPERRAPAASPEARAAIAEAAITIAPAPVLSLIGIAEDTAQGGMRRTAIIALGQAQGGPEQGRAGSGAGDTLFIVTIGEGVADRYQVSAIGADVVELKDTLTGGIRRLAMR